MSDLRIGFGQDIHRLVPGRDFILGGLKIPYGRGLLGHSDADALLHAVMDALLGALALDDIGKFFPDTDPAFAGISSLLLLETVVEKVNELGYSICNVDTIVHCEKPKISPFREEMRKKLAAGLKIEHNRVSIKAGTNEGLDSIGRGEAVMCQAIVLLSKRC